MLEAKTRRCAIRDVKTDLYEEATFHGFFLEQYVIDASPMVGGHNGGQVSTIVALIEMPDGIVRRVPPTHIRFVDL